MGCGASKNSPNASEGRPVATGTSVSPSVVLILGLAVEPICRQLCTALGATFLDASPDALMRAEVTAQSELGSEIAVLAKQGKLLPAELCARVVNAAIAVGPGGLHLLAGYPNSVEALDAFEAQIGLAPSLALLFDQPEASARQKLKTSGLDEASVELRLNAFRVAHRVTTALEDRGLLRRVDASATAAAAVATARGFIEQQQTASAGGRPAAAAASGGAEAVRIVFVMGGPDVDTAAQCSRLAAKFGCVLLSPASLMRAELDAGTAAGTAIEEIIRAGKIVPAHLTIDMLQSATAKSPSSTFLLEGFPRTMDALGLFEKAFGSCARALVFEAAEAQPAASEQLSRRIRAHRSQTMPVVASLEGRKLVRRVKAAGDEDALFKAACQAYSAK